MWRREDADAQREIFVFGNAGNYAGAGYIGDGHDATGNMHEG
jgi:hypothetical protein